MDCNTARYTNKHTVYVVTGMAKKEQLEMSVNFFKKELVRMFPKDGYEKCEVIVNLVTDNAGNMYHYAYLWVSDPRVYYILVGMNPDGSERYEDEKEEKEDVDFDNLDFDDVFTEASKIKKPSIRKPLGPILSLPATEYTSEQKIQALEKLKTKATESGEKVEDITAPDYAYYITSRAHASKTEDGYNYSVLYSNVPVWVTEDMLKEVFSKFSSEKSGIYPKIFLEPTFRFNKEKNTKEDRKKAFVEFSASYATDGMFALLITRRLLLKDKAQERKNVEALRKNKSAIVPEVKFELTCWNFLNTKPKYDKVKNFPEKSGAGSSGSGKPFRDGFQSVRK